MDAPLWTPSPERVAAARLTAFIEHLRRAGAGSFDDYAALHRFSTERPDRFWAAVWDFCGVAAETRGDVVVVDGDRMPGARFFPRARLNFAENLLREADRQGLPWVVERLDEYAARYGRRLEPAELLRDMARRGATFHKR